MLRAVRLALPALCLLALPVQGAVFTVTKTADTLDGDCDHDCSLREAVSAANDGGSGEDVVVIPPGIYVLTRTGAGEDGNATGDLDVTDETILVGAGPGTTILDGFGFDRVLDAHAWVEIFGVTIRNGRVAGDGGGLLVRPNFSPYPVHLRRSVVSGNLAQNGGDGGGIATQGGLQVSESAILENQAEGDGGAISAGRGAGYISLTNVTVSGNRAAGSGGGLAYTVGQATIVSSTVVFNQAQVSGGGTFSWFPLIPGSFPREVFGSIVAQNTAPAAADCPASSGGYNVIGAGEGCGLDPTDRSGTAAQPLRPVAETLSTGLGPTPVHALLEGSPALDMVPASYCPPADQAGQARTAPCDAGAWEQVDHPVCVPGGSILCLQGGRFRVSASWKTDPALPGNPAQAVPLTDDTGNYWFFDPDNLEVMIKVLDGCALNQRWWVFASGLTDVGVDLMVEDLETGRVWLDHHDPGRTYPPRLDTDALSCDSPLTAPLFAAQPPGQVIAPVSVLAVTKTADTDDGACDHDCSLREAVIAANAEPGTRVIVIGPGVHTLSIPGRGEDMAQTGDLDVTGDLVILGDGADRTVIDGNGIDRVLDVRSTGSLELYDATVRNGRARPTTFQFGDGGGIRSSGPLTLVRAQVMANHSDHDGGGVHSLELAARDSTFSGNIANNSGGGLAAVLLELENVTVSGNLAGDRAGGVLLYFNSAVLRYTTITDNSASIGGGLSLFLEDCAGSPCSGYLELQGTLIAGNSGNTRPDCWELPAHAGDFNLFGVAEGCAPGLGDRAGSLAQPLDPQLIALSGIGGGGGPTLTHALRAFSPAVDLAPAVSCPAVDQRGRARPSGARCDAGAFELLPNCQPGGSFLCLGAGDRFRVTTRWTARGGSGSGQAVPLAGLTGSFWFFDAANLELTVKVLDGCAVNDRYWVFVSGLTDVGVEVTVEDLVTNTTWTHSHAEGTPFQPRLDTNALESCP